MPEALISFLDWVLAAAATTTIVVVRCTAVETIAAAQEDQQENQNPALIVAHVVCLLSVLAYTAIILRTRYLCDGNSKKILDKKI